MLQNLTTEELESELKKRKDESKKLPPMLPNPDFTKLIETIISGLTRATKDDYLDDDIKTYVWEEALTAIFGKDFFAWRKKQPW